MTKHQDRRWYDQDIACHRLLEQVKFMPQRESREFCARVLIHFCDKIRKEISRRSMDSLSVSSIGAPAISSLYRFGEQKRRWYDAEPVTQKAAGMLYTLPSDGMAALGFKLADTFGLMQIYAMVCDQLDQPPDMKEMANICITSLQAGSKEAEDVLVAIVGEDLYRSIANH